METMATYFFRSAAKDARQAIGKPVMAEYTVRHGFGPIQQAIEMALHHDEQAAELIEKRDLALAEAKRQVAPTTK